MTRPLRQRLENGAARRDPPYKSVLELNDEERAQLAEKIGGMQNYNPVVLRELARQDRRFFAPLIMSILSAEFRGIDFFGRFVVETQEYNVPWHMTLAFARQTYDEARHTHLNMQLLESLDSPVGEYPDIILGPSRDEIPPEELDPAILMARINVALEGFALTTFEETRELAEKTGETLIAHCHDYNMADEVTHVALGDYWLEKLSDEQPWRKNRAKAAQEEFERGIALVREMAKQFVGATTAQSSNGGSSSHAHPEVPKDAPPSVSEG
jgi:uncharacterized ferritin-like protein (DUF455 family)